MKKEIENLVAEIKEIRKDIEKGYYYHAARFGCRCWFAGNRDKSTIERLKFHRDYFKAYGNYY